jgi:lysozyme
VDTLGVPTVGVGRNLRTKGITSAEAFYLLDHDIDDTLHDLATFSWFGHLDVVRQRALADMRFNLGPSRFSAFTQMLHAVAIGDYEQAAQQMLQSQWATQVKGRATELAEMMRTGEHEQTN